MALNSKPAGKSASASLPKQPIAPEKSSGPLPAHLAYLEKCEEQIQTAEGHPVELWELTVPTDPGALSGWASAFRQHYCPDPEIDALREGTGLSRKEYLLNLIFPHVVEPPGPAVRAGDFAEILVSDYLEYVLGYWVPRSKYAEKATRNESVKGVDIVGFILTTPGTPSRSDTLMAFEVKAQFSGKSYQGRLQDAVNDSSKDYLRLAQTLNATKRRLRASGELERALMVQRFQNQSDHPYLYRSGAAAVLSENAFDEKAICTTTTVSAHKNREHLDLFVVRGTQLMGLVHALYERAADEA